MLLKLHADLKELVHQSRLQFLTLLGPKRASQTFHSEASLY
jgi:hypothetical protein